MRHLLLTKPDTGIAQTNVLAVVLVGILKILPPLDIIALGFAEQERILQMVDIGRDGILRNVLPSPGTERICDFLGIRQRTDRRTQQIKEQTENILTHDLLALHNVLDIDFREQRRQIICLCGIVRTGQHQRHSAIEGIRFKCVLLIPADRRIVLCKAEGVYLYLIAAPTELGQNIP